MQPVLIVTGAERPDLDTIIVWDDGDRHVAYGYHQGHVVRTQPVEPHEIAVEHLRNRFQIPTRHELAVTQVADLPVSTHRAMLPGRWG